MALVAPLSRLYDGKFYFSEFYILCHTSAFDKPPRVKATQDANVSDAQNIKPHLNE
jgi:hypothetical protein